MSTFVYEDRMTSYVRRSKRLSIGKHNNGKRFNPRKALGDITNSKNKALARSKEINVSGRKKQPKRVPPLKRKEQPPHWKGPADHRRQKFSVPAADLTGEDPYEQHNPKQKNSTQREDWAESDENEVEESEEGEDDEEEDYSDDDEEESEESEMDDDSMDNDEDPDGPTCKENILGATNPLYLPLRPAMNGQMSVRQMPQQPHIVLPSTARVGLLPALHTSRAHTSRPDLGRNVTSSPGPTFAVSERKKCDVPGESDHIMSSPEAGYIDEIYLHLRQSELKYAPHPDYMNLVQRDVNHTMRTILVDWLVEVSEEYRLTDQTLYLTVNYVDRLLGKVGVNRTKLQLVGVTCMLIAAKFQEIYPPSVDEFVYISDSTYTREEVLGMEKVLLTTLQFSLAVTTIRDFAGRFAMAARLNKRTHALLNFITEFFLQEQEHLKYPPSVIACSSVYLALFTTNQNPWPNALSLSSQYGLNDITPCVRDIHRMYSRVYNDPDTFKAVKEKYAQEKFYDVSSIEPPPSLYA